MSSSGGVFTSSTLPQLPRLSSDILPPRISSASLVRSSLSPSMYRIHFFFRLLKWETHTIKIEREREKKQKCISWLLIKLIWVLKVSPWYGKIFKTKKKTMKQNLCINRLFNTENKNNAKIPINKLINLYTNVTAICLHEYCGSDLFSKSCSRKKHAISNKKKITSIENSYKQIIALCTQRHPLKIKVNQIKTNRWKNKITHANGKCWK